MNSILTPQESKLIISRRISDIAVDLSTTTYEIKSIYATLIYKLHSFGIPNNIIANQLNMSDDAICTILLTRPQPPDSITTYPISYKLSDEGLFKACADNNPIDIINHLRWFQSTVTTTTKDQENIKTAFIICIMINDTLSSQQFLNIPSSHELILKDKSIASAILKHIESSGNIHLFDTSYSLFTNIPEILIGLGCSAMKNIRNSQYKELPFIVIGKILKYYTDSQTSSKFKEQFTTISVKNYSSLIILCGYYAETSNTLQIQEKYCINTASNIKLATDIITHLFTTRTPLKEVIYKSIIAVLGYAGMIDSALKYIIIHMKSDGVLPKNRTFMPLLTQCFKTSDLYRIRKIHECMIKLNIQITQEAHGLILKTLTSWFKNFGCYSIYEIDDYMNYSFSIFRKLTHQTKGISSDCKQIIKNLCTTINDVVNECKLPYTIDSIPSPHASISHIKPNQYGECEIISEKLLQTKLTMYQKSCFCSHFSKLACTSPKTRSQFNKFKQFLTKSGKIDIIIDAANVGKHNTGSSYNNLKFSYFQVNEMFQYFANQGYSVCIILHKQWLTNTTTKHIYMPYYSSWKQTGHVYMVQPGNYDDIYWLYAAMSVKTSDKLSNGPLVITNDLLRDHIHRISDIEQFKSWMKTNIVSYSFDISSETPYIISHGDSHTDSIELCHNSINIMMSFTFPKKYSTCFQEFHHGKDSEFCFPIIDGDGWWMVFHYES